jgi:hypothetical protein
MITIAIGRISRISFYTDMTRADAPVLPLGYMLEAAWPDKARWLGLIGRTRLTPLELDRVNETTWPELRAPFGMLADLFEAGWAAAWGDAGVAIQNGWSRSSFGIDTTDYPLGDAVSAETAEAWSGTCDVLCTQLNALHVKLAPTLIAKPIKLRPAISKAPPPVARPLDIRTRQGAPETAMAA